MSVTQRWTGTLAQRDALGKAVEQWYGRFQAADQQHAEASANYEAAIARALPRNRDWIAAREQEVIRKAQSKAWYFQDRLEKAQKEYDSYFVAIEDELDCFGVNS